MKFLAVSFLVLAVIVYKTNGLCNTCSGITGLACISSTSFTICDGGTINPTSPAVPCPTGTFCSANAQVCSATALPSCAKCGQCVDGNPYACNNYTSFSFCDGTIINPTVYNCPTGLVCAIGSNPICSDPTITGIGATCPSSTTISTTTPAPTADPITNPSAFCTAKKVAGRYKVPSDTTCQKFISCISSAAGIWTGNVYQCPAGTYFNETLQKCGTALPAGCSVAF